VAGLGWAVAFALSSAQGTPSGAKLKRFFYTGAEQTFVVPSGVTLVHVVALGAEGGSALGVPGGYGTLVSAQVGVHPGETLYIEVGGAGNKSDARSCPGASACLYAPGGFNGGGSSVAQGGGHSGGGGGGASDVQTRSIRGGLAALGSRLVVAGGGGGAGGDSSIDRAYGGHGGSEGAGVAADGLSSFADHGALGGGAGSAAGEGGVVGEPETSGAGGKAGGASVVNPSVYLRGNPGSDGSLGVGGTGGGIARFQPCPACAIKQASGAGGGGGGGYHGGGGGGSGGLYECAGQAQGCNPAISPDAGGGGGGGAGSSYTPNGGTTRRVTDETGDGTVFLSWSA
jgi:hypothetical protein